MIQVVIQNFQSIEHVVFKIDGFTALVGRSNLGKSAVVRAVKSALTGATGTDFVRHSSECPRRTKNAKSCKCFSSVHLKGEGLDLLWEKGETVNRYVYNGVVYDKVERGTPEFLKPHFSMAKIGDRSELLQVADQFRHQSGSGPIFLLDQSGSVVADVLSDVAKLDRVNVAARLAEKDRKESVAIRKVRAQDILDLQSKLTEFDGLDGATTKLVCIEKDFSGLESLQGRIDSLSDYIQRTTELAQRIREMMDVHSVAVPDPTFLPGQLDSFLSADRMQTNLVEKTQLIEALTTGADVEVPDRDLFSLGQSLGSLQSWVDKLVIFKEILTVGKPVETLPTLEGTSVASMLTKTAQVLTMAQRYEGVEGAIQKMEGDILVLDATLQGLLEEITSYGSCPTCTQPLSEHGGIWHG